MKKLNLYLSYVLIAISSFCFVSCDDDVERAMTLSGQWRGNFGMFYEEEYHGKIYHYDSFDTDIVFYPDYDYATHGWGKQVDWYKEGPNEKLYYRFKWEIHNGVIYLNYLHDHELDTEIHEYAMNNDRFTGFFVNASERFYLYKIADYYDWTYYRDDWDYYEWHRDGYRYKTRATEEPAGTIIRRGNRFADNAGRRQAFQVADK